MKRLPILTVRALGIALLMGATTCTCTAVYTGYYDYCDPAVPYDECYATRRAPESDQVASATRVALTYIEDHPAQGEDWDWRSGVLMFALTELHRVTGDERIRAYYQAWLDHHIEQGYEQRLVWSDGCPPALTAIALLNDPSTDESKLAEYQKVVDDVLDYLDEAPRTAEGGISHNGVVGQPSVWVDSLFMYGMVFNRWAELSDDSSRLDIEAEQIEIFAGLLQDENGLLRHAYEWPGADESVYWARGNGWVTASLADYLRVRARGEQSDPQVEKIFRDQVRAIIAAQDSETGLWWTLLNHPGEAYQETSASALFAYGIARAWRYGILGDGELAAARKAMEGIEQKIEDDIVSGVSLFTDPWSFEEYVSVPVEDDVNYGVGAVILALIETSGLPD